MSRQGSEVEGRMDGDTKYEPPALVSLGTLAELTQGGGSGPDDGYGGAGDSGSLGG